MWTGYNEANTIIQVHVIMSDVFISYSRRDIDFVRHLFDQLTARDRKPWADWQDIPPTADSLAEIYSGIEAANTFLFVISPDSVTFSDIIRVVFVKTGELRCESICL